MDAELIAAAAKLCGWKRHYGRWAASGTWMTAPERSPERLTNAGLIALWEALGDHGWVWDKVGDERGNLCHRWRRVNQRTSPVSAMEVMHPDGATAACMAAWEELKHGH